MQKSISMTEKRGADQFLESSDKYFSRLAKVIDEEKFEQGAAIDLERIREISEIIKITAQSIKVSSEEKKEGEKKSPLEKIKAKKNGEQVVV